MSIKLRQNREGLPRHEGFWKQSRKWGLENEGPPRMYRPAKQGERYQVTGKDKNIVLWNENLSPNTRFR